MWNDEILGRWHHLKNNMQTYLAKFSDRDYKKSRRKNQLRPSEIHIDNYHYESHRVDNLDDDLPLTLNKDPGPGIKYAYTENSEFARGAEKVDAHGIDSFGEEDTFDPDEADDFQDYRNRNQNSDLSKRFFTHGMKDSDLH